LIAAAVHVYRQTDIEIHRHVLNIGFDARGDEQTDIAAVTRVSIDTTIMTPIACTQRLLKETNIKDRFTEHDLRAKCASDAETLGRAQQLLGHADSKITERVYRRKPEVVRPLR
jgi:integrase